MKWPFVHRRHLEDMASEVLRLREELTEAKRAERVAEEVRQANADRDAWAAKVQGLEDAMDARVNAGVAAALRAIESAHERAKARGNVGAAPADGKSGSPGEAGAATCDEGVAAGPPRGPDFAH